MRDAVVTSDSVQNSTPIQIETALASHRECVPTGAVVDTSFAHVWRGKDAPRRLALALVKPETTLIHGLTFADGLESPKSRIG
jgi:hypothetical protein